ncbi:MAG: methylmalonyl-CoA carboxyltransferase [Clostridia bacterium]|nr:methylmalonyl-CoA carboxyltransferase [Clostridia bacterium]
MGNTQELAEALARRQAVLQGDPERIEKQRAAGKLTARERVERLLDPGSFVEMDVLVSGGADGAGVVTGSGTVDARPVYVFAQDYTVRGGAMGVRHAQKVCRVLDLAVKTGAPVIALCDSAGVRVDEGARAMNAYASIYQRLAKLSGVCPLIALILGPAIGGAALIAQLADIAIQAADVGRLMVYGPQVVSSLTGRDCDMKSLGGAETMAAQGGVALTAATEAEAIALAAKLIGLLPSCNEEDAPLVDTDDLNRLLTEVSPEDSEGLLSGMADSGDFVELFPAWGGELRVALARMGGRTVGLVVSNAAVNAGELAPAACAKAARFIRFCDCFSLPVVSLINSRGVQVPSAETQSWTMITAAQLLCAYTEASVPKVSVIVGSAIGQAYVAMGGQGSADLTYAWPGAVISALTPEAAVQVLYADEMRQDTAPAAQTRSRLARRFASEVADGVNAAAEGMIDDVIEPAQTRKYVLAALEMLSCKREPELPRKHGNLPL